MLGEVIGWMRMAKDGQWEGHVLAKEVSHCPTSADLVLRGWDLTLTLGVNLDIWGDDIYTCLISFCF